jgi:hypothetical protein
VPKTKSADRGVQEASTNIIHVDEFDIGTVKFIVDFMYKGAYDDGTTEF